MPGLVDTHIHAPQYINSGTGYDRMLLDWLKTYTFPTEAKFSDVGFARDVYTKAVVSWRGRREGGRREERIGGRGG